MITLNCYKTQATFLSIRVYWHSFPGMGSDLLLGCSKFYISFCFFHPVCLAFTQHSGPSLQIAFPAAEKGLDFQEAQPSLLNTKWFLLSEMRTSNILQNLSVWMGLRATSKGLWAFVVVWFFFCNRLWNGSWHCFSCDIVAWIGTTGLWDSPLMSAPQHPFPALPCTVLSTRPPCLREDTMCRCGNKSD